MKCHHAVSVNIVLGARRAVATRCTQSASSLRVSMCMKCHHAVSENIVLGAHRAVATRCTPSASSLRGSMCMKCHHAGSENIVSGCALSCRHTVYAECIVPERRHV